MNGPHSLPVYLSRALGVLACCLVAWSPEVSAQLGLGAGCSLGADLRAPRYLGKQAGKDAIEVTWTVARGGSPGGFGLGGGAQLGLSPVTECAIQSGFVASVDVTVKVVRALGHQDTATLSVGSPLNQETVRNVQVPRGALETDPKTYVVEIKGKVSGPLNQQLLVSGNGTPALAGATQNLSVLSLPGGNLGPSCLPKLAVTALSFAGASSAQAKESTTVSWAFSTPGSFGPCVKRQPTTVRVKLRRTNGTTSEASVSVPQGSSTATVELPGPPSPVASFDVTVLVPGSLELPVAGRIEGSF